MDDFFRRFLSYFVLFILPVALLAFVAATGTGGILAMILAMVWLGAGVLFANPSSA